MQAVPFINRLRQGIIQVLRRIGEGRENNNFLIARIDGMRYFRLNIGEQALEFGILIWCDILDLLE